MCYMWILRSYMGQIPSSPFYFGYRVTTSKRKIANPSIITDLKSDGYPYVLRSGPLNADYFKQIHWRIQV